MLIFSWNVAAWPTVIQELGTEDPTTFFDSHNADIVCLQEVKVNKRRIVNDARKLGANSTEWDSFWAPCTTDDSTKGFQGVATWARKGLTYRADPCVFCDPDLDSQGRCIFTEHASFVLFNVYAPSSSNGIAARMKFFRALRRAMKDKRDSCGKPVILCGDLNVVAYAADVHYTYALVNVGELISDEAQANDAALKEDDGDTVSFDVSFSSSMIVRQLRENWPLILDALSRRRAISRTTTSTITGERRKRYRLAVDLPGADCGQKGANTIEIGSLQDSEDAVMNLFSFKSKLWQDPETGQDIEIFPKYSISVGDLGELMKGIGKVKWSKSDMISLAENAGKSLTAEPLLSWLHKFIFKEDQMVDTFRYLYPQARFRFTCWNQYTNGRYGNLGFRIDYFIVDEGLLPSVTKAKDPQLILRCGCSLSSSHRKQADAGICAATGGGLFKPAEFFGGGIQTAPELAMKSQFGDPHTGIVYTPPKYSDHVAVTLNLFNEEIGGREKLYGCVLDVNDAKTRASQPHKSQLSMHSFFRKQGKESSVKPALSKSLLPSQNFSKKSARPPPISQSLDRNSRPNKLSRKQAKNARGSARITALFSKAANDAP